MKIQAITNFDLRPEILFNLLSDLTRLRCLSLLQQQEELCVCELSYGLDMVQPKISRHLALLRKFNIVADRRKGIWVYYCIHPRLPNWVQHIIKTTGKTIQQIEPYQHDTIRLIKMPNRPISCESKGYKKRVCVVKKKCVKLS